MGASPSGGIESCFTRIFKGSALLFLLLSLSLPVLFFTGANADAAQVTLAWDSSTGSKVVGYRLYYGTVHGSYAYYLDVGNTTSYDLSRLSTGATYYFALTGYDDAGDQSSYSNEVSYTVPSACTYAISSASHVFAAGGGTGKVSVTTQSGCAWTAASAAPWMSITSGGAGTGSGTVVFSVAANAATSPRIAASTIEGLSFTLTQAGVAAHTVTASAETGGPISLSGR